MENNRNSLIVDFCKKGQTQQLFEIIHQSEDFKFLDERQNSLLNIALKNGQWPTALELIEAGFDYYHSSHPTLISACQYAKDDIEGLELLVKSNVDINAQNHQQRTALMTSCLLGHINKAKFLLDNKAKINLQDINGNNEIIDAIHSNNSSLVDLILSKQPMVEQVNEQGQCALLIAMMQKKPNEEIVKKLLNFGYDPELKDHQQNTAWLISSRKHPKIQKLISKHLNEVKQIELPFFTNDYKKVYNEQEKTIENIKPSIEEQVSLLSTSENETQPNSDSIQPEEKKMQQSNLEKKYKPTKSLFSEPKKNLSNNEEWFLAAKIGNLGKLNGQIINDIDINCKDSKGCTALIRASGNKRRAVVSFLLQQNAEIEIRSNNGSTALSSSIIGNCRHVAGLLLDKGANPNGLGPSNYSYTTLAAAQWNEAMLSILYRYKADIHIINQQNQNLAHIVALAAEYYQDTSKAKASLMFLQDHGVDLNLQDKEGNTPLMLLCGIHKKKYSVNDRNIATIALQIIKLGATPVLSNSKGITALDVCRKHKLMQTKGVLMNALSWNEF